MIFQRNQVAVQRESPQLIFKILIYSFGSEDQPCDLSGLVSSRERNLLGLYVATSRLRVKKKLLADQQYVLTRSSLLGTKEGITLLAYCNVMSFGWNLEGLVLVLLF